MRSLWLLIDCSKNLPTETPFSQKYLLFEDPGQVRDEALRRGYSDWLGKLEPESMQIGSMNMYAHHPVDIRILRLEVQ